MNNKYHIVLWVSISDEKIERDTARLAKKISNTKKTFVGIKTRFIFNVMTGMQSAGMGSSPTEKEHWEKIKILCFFIQKKS